MEAFLARPNVTQKSKYSALLLLSEVPLRRERDGAVASQMVRLFVGQLELALRKPKLSKKEFERRKRGLAPKQKGKPLREEDNRLVRTLINGIRRAMPYMDVVGSPLQEETVNALFKVCHTVDAFSTRALSLDGRP